MLNTSTDFKHNLITCQYLTTEYINTKMWIPLIECIPFILYVLIKETKIEILSLNFLIIFTISVLNTPGTKHRAKRRNTDTPPVGYHKLRFLITLKLADFS